MSESLRTTELPTELHIDQEQTDPKGFIASVRVLHSSGELVPRNFHYDTAAADTAQSEVSEIIDELGIVDTRWAEAITEHFKPLLKTFIASSDRTKRFGFAEISYQEMPAANQRQISIQLLTEYCQICQLLADPDGTITRQVVASNPVLFRGPDEINQLRAKFSEISASDFRRLVTNNVRNPEAALVKKFGHAREREKAEQLTLSPVEYINFARQLLRQGDLNVTTARTKEVQRVRQALAVRVPTLLVDHPAYARSPQQVKEEFSRYAALLAEVTLHGSFISDQPTLTSLEEPDLRAITENFFDQYKHIVEMLCEPDGRLRKRVVRQNPVLYYPPAEIRGLLDSNTDLSPGTLRLQICENPANPHQAVQYWREQEKLLRAKYPTIGKSVIRNAIRRKSDPEHDLRKKTEPLSGICEVDQDLQRFWEEELHDLSAVSTAEAAPSDEYDLADRFLDFLWTYRAQALRSDGGFYFSEFNAHYQRVLGKKVHGVRQKRILDGLLAAEMITIWKDQSHGQKIWLTEIGHDVLDFCQGRDDRLQELINDVVLAAPEEIDSDQNEVLQAA